MFDFQTAFNIILGAFGALSGWLLNTLYSCMKELTVADKLLADKVQHIEVLVAGHYIPRHEFEAKMETFFMKLDKIENKIDMRFNGK
jgi:hypothetical protein